MEKLFKQTIGRYNGEKVDDYYRLVKNNSEKEEGGVDANVFKYIKEILPEQLEGQTVIDLGCGDGRWSKYLSSLKSKEVCGFDISEDMIKRAREKYGEIDGLRFVRADMQKLPLKNNSTDKALSTFSLMYFENLEDVIAEAGRVLKKDGELYIATNIINIDDSKLLTQLKGKNIPIDLGIKKKLSLENLVQPIGQYREAFKKAGLEIIKEKHFKPIGVEIPDDYEHKKDMELEKVVFIVRKK